MSKTALRPNVTRPRPAASEVATERSGGASHVRIDTADPRPSVALDRSVLMCGCASEAMELLPARSVQTVVTSPPYWSLRDYEMDRQIGRDDPLNQYLLSIVDMFEKLHRVLSDDGTVWLNVGDAYTSGNRRYRAPDKKNRARAISVRPTTPQGLKPKDLIGLPWRLAFALQDAGWWLRSEVIWHKPNAHPESVRDRPTKAHETVFLLSKSQDYYYDVDAVRGPNQRRLRTVWDIPTEPQRRNAEDDDHPAMMPMTLARRCVAITSRPNDVVLDPYAGSGTTLLAARDLGRKWVGVELNPTFVDLIERRINAHTPNLFATTEPTRLSIPAEWALAESAT
ncbi:MAG: site-specific DNA-methyltransferase [Spirochaetaceae bacterium]|nr:site-specific DNA-methyltransferase [Spirochaetaceae bacterium]